MIWGGWSNRLTTRGSFATQRSSSPCLVRSTRDLARGCGKASSSGLSRLGLCFMVLVMILRWHHWSAVSWCVELLQRQLCVCLRFPLCLSATMAIIVVRPLKSLVQSRFTPSPLDTHFPMTGFYRRKLLPRRLILERPVGINQSCVLDEDHAFALLLRCWNSPEGRQEGR